VDTETLKMLAHYLVMILFLFTLRSHSCLETQCRQWMVVFWALSYVSDYFSLAGTYFHPRVYALFTVAQSCMGAVADTVLGYTQLFKYIDFSTCE